MFSKIDRKETKWVGKKRSEREIISSYVIIGSCCIRDDEHGCLFGPNCSILFRISSDIWVQMTRLVQFSIEILVQPNKRNDSLLQFSAEISVLPNRRVKSHSPDLFSFSSIPFSEIISLQFHSLYQTHPNGKWHHKDL